MSFFLPPNVKPLLPSENIDSWSDQDVELARTDFFNIPKGLENRTVDIDYTQL